VDRHRPNYANWRAEHLFALKQAVNLYDSYQASIAECDVQLAEVLGRLAVHDDAPEPPKSGRGRPVKVEKFDLRKALYRACGVDLTRIEGIDVGTALTMIAEVGPDLSRFKTVKHFASWLGLCPGTKISGGKVLSGASKRIANRLAQALRLSAVAAGRSHSALGAYYRRHVGASRQSQGSARHGAQTRTLDLYADDQRRSVCRSRPGLLRTAAPATGDKESEKEGSRDGLLTHARRGGCEHEIFV
jgi:Transposase IS116/IS110/IS902 family